jgi:hypothetical protein
MICFQVSWLKFNVGLWVRGTLEGVPTFQQTPQLLSLGLTFLLAISNSWLTPTLAVAIFPLDDNCNVCQNRKS